MDLGKSQTITGIIRALLQVKPNDAFLIEQPEFRFSRFWIPFRRPNHPKRKAEWKFWFVVRRTAVAMKSFVVWSKFSVGNLRPIRPVTKKKRNVRFSFKARKRTKLFSDLVVFQFLSIWFDARGAPPSPKTFKVFRSTFWHKNRWKTVRREKNLL